MLLYKKNNIVVQYLHIYVTGNDRNIYFYSKPSFA